MDHAASSTTPALLHRPFVPRRVLTTFATPVVRPCVSSQQEQEIAGLLARTIAFRREGFREADPLAVPDRAHTVPAVPALRADCPA